MNTNRISRRLGLAFAVTLTAAASGREEAPAAKSTAPAPPVVRAPAGRTTAKGPLPDPLLLDGSVQAVEKKSDYGMIGDFELPGDEKVQNGKVGGPRQDNAAAQGGQGQSPLAGLPQGGGAGGQAQASNGRSGGNSTASAGGGQPAGPNPPEGGGPAGGQQIPAAAGNPVGGAGEPGAQPQGIAVAELGGTASGQVGSAGAGNSGGRPPTVAIGDKAMRIEPSASAPGVVGTPAQIADGHIQQHDKGTGTGGKAPTSAQGPGRVEKGRVIPAGL